MPETVLVLGASPKPERYSFKAVELLRQYKHKVLPVNPYHSQVSGAPCIKRVSDVSESVDTVTVYIRAEQLEADIGALIGLAPRRVIFNPGTESKALAAKLQQAGIGVEEACTLVLLRTGQF